MMKYLTQPQCLQQQEHLLPPPSTLHPPRCPFGPLLCLSHSSKAPQDYPSLIEKHTNAPGLFLHSALGSKISDHRLVVQPPPTPHPPPALHADAPSVREDAKTNQQEGRRGGEVERS